MKMRSCTIIGNLYPATSCWYGTPKGTTHRNGGGPVTTKENQQPCSCVPNLSYILKNIVYRATETQIQAFTRVKGLLGFENIGGKYA